MYACLYRPPAPEDPAHAGALLAIARDFSPRYEHRADLVSIDVSGLDRLIGPPATIGEELRRDAAARGIQVHVALARTRVAALVLALARPGVTIVDPGKERESLASLPIAILEKVCGSWFTTQGSESSAMSLGPLCARWGIGTLGEFAALPSAALSSRLGRQALVWQTIARGEDEAPLVPTPPEERFEASLDLEWPIEDLEPLSFVLTRLLEPLSARLERRDRGAAVLHLELQLVSRETHARSLQLPSPIRDVRALRTLLLLDLESHPPAAAADRVTIRVDPTPGRVVQHTLFTRAHPTPEQLSTLLARLGALIGQNRIGAPAAVDSYRPGAFAMTPFATEHDARGQPPAASQQPLAAALRRCRQPVPARAVVEDGRPMRLATDRRGFPGGRVLTAAGPWRTSGHWWKARGSGLEADAASYWNREEWDVALADGGVYRIFRDRDTDGWFIDAIVD
jgi:protein ImuB